VPADTIYLEALDRTQDLLNIKWTLLSAGYSIRSTWHDAEGSPSSLKDHWNAKDVQQICSCDSLVISCDKSEGAAPELAMMAGVALAHGLQVIWIGPPVGALNAFAGARQFKTAEDYVNLVLRQDDFPVGLNYRTKAA